MSKRNNIVLPETTVQTIDRMVKPGQRSRFINEAVRHFVANRSAEAPRARLEQTAVRDQDLDRDIASDWFAADHETWQQLDTEPKPARKPPIPSGARPDGARPDAKPGDSKDAARAHHSE